MKHRKKWRKSERERESVLDEQRTKPSMALGLLCQSKKQITFGTHTHTQTGTLIGSTLAVAYCMAAANKCNLA